MTASAMSADVATAGAVQLPRRPRWRRCSRGTRIRPLAIGTTAPWTVADDGATAGRGDGAGQHRRPAQLLALPDRRTTTSRRPAAGRWPPARRRRRARPNRWPGPRPSAGRRRRRGRRRSRSPRPRTAPRRPPPRRARRAPPWSGTARSTASRPDGEVGPRQPAAGHVRRHAGDVRRRQPHGRGGQRGRRAVRSRVGRRRSAVAPSPSTTRSSTPTPHSWRSVPAGSRPVRTSVCAAPTLGCPAKGSSAKGVKIRTR